jgi:diphthamide synthase (EF-2-diphthine--ammonia ligase)
MLFGTPHKGLSTDELLRMVQSDLEDTVEPEQREYRELRLKLLKQLEEGSSFLEEQREALRPLCEELQLRIFSFY